MAVQLSQRLVPYLCALIAVGFTSCMGVSENESGRLAARGTGQLPATPLERIAFDAAMLHACGDGAVLDAAAIQRRPYLQQVEPSGATVVWTSTEPAPMRLEVTRPDGTLVAEVESTIDDSVAPSDDLQHVAVVDGLEAGTTHCYRVVGREGPALERVGFRTAPAADAGEPVTFVAIGDMGSGMGDQYAVLEQLRTVSFDLMVTVGDNAYEDGTLEEFERNFFGVYADVLQSTPVYPTAGNHDYRTDDGAPYLGVFVLPENGGPEGTERWYSFDRGDVHFVGLDSESIGPLQRAWLEADLAASDATWTVVMMHDPPFSSGDHGSSITAREELCPLFERYGVDLVLAGHDHHYERTKPVDGPVYIVTGGGGRGTRPAGISSFTEYSEDVLHFVWVRVEGNTLDLRAIDATGREFDSLLLTH